MSSSMTFGDYNRPDPMLSYSPINLGVFKGHDFDIDPEFIMSIGRDAFHGLESEDVFGHLKTFDHLCGFVKREGVPNEIIKLLLFPFCLKDQARKWLYSHPPNTFSSWNDLAQAFLYKYFPPSKTFKFRHDILTFHQGEFERFSESWERFKELLSDCPHHGIPSWLTTLTFFQNLLPYNRELIIIASRGKFDDMSVEEAYDLIERLARADEDWGFDNLTKNIDLLLHDDVHIVQSQHVPFVPMNMCDVDDFLSTCGSCGGVGHTFQVCPSYSYSPPSLNLCVDDDVIEESFHEEYEVVDEPYDEECVSLTCDSLEMNWNENCVLEEIELRTPCLEDICIPSIDLIVDNLDEEGDVINDFEDPILEKFEGFHYVEDEQLTSIDCVDPISLTLSFDVMVIDDNCDNPSMEIALCDNEIFDVHFLRHKPLTSRLLVSWFHGWSCLVGKMHYDHFLEDWSSVFDKLMRSLTGFLDDLLVRCD